VASPQYHLRQAEVVARLALAESDPEKAAALHVLALEHYDKAEQAKSELVLPPTHQPPKPKHLIIKSRES
jgi:hypothetical protein